MVFFKGCLYGSRVFLDAKVLLHGSSFCIPAHHEQCRAASSYRISTEKTTRLFGCALGATTENLAFTHGAYALGSAPSSPRATPVFSLARSLHSFSCSRAPSTRLSQFDCQTCIYTHVYLPTLYALTACLQLTGSVHTITSAYSTLLHAGALQYNSEIPVPYGSLADPGRNRSFSDMGLSRKLLPCRTSGVLGKPLNNWLRKR